MEMHAAELKAKLSECIAAIVHTFQLYVQPCDILTFECMIHVTYACVVLSYTVRVGECDLSLSLLSFPLTQLCKHPSRALLNVHK